MLRLLLPRCWHRCCIRGMSDAVKTLEFFKCKCLAAGSSQGHQRRSGRCRQRPKFTEPNKPELETKKSPNNGTGNSPKQSSSYVGYASRQCKTKLRRQETVCCWSGRWWLLIGPGLLTPESGNSQASGANWRRALHLYAFNIVLHLRIDCGLGGGTAE